MRKLGVQIGHYLLTHKKRVALLVGFISAVLAVLELDMVKHIGIALFVERVFTYCCEV